MPLHIKTENLTTVIILVDKWWHHCWYERHSFVLLAENCLIIPPFTTVKKQLLRIESVESLGWKCRVPQLEKTWSSLIWQSAKTRRNLSNANVFFSVLWAVHLALVCSICGANLLCLTFSIFKNPAPLYISTLATHCTVRLCLCKL